MSKIEKVQELSDAFREYVEAENEVRKSMTRAAAGVRLAPDEIGLGMDYASFVRLRIARLIAHMAVVARCES